VASYARQSNRNVAKNFAEPGASHEHVRQNHWNNYGAYDAVSNGQVQDQVIASLQTKATLGDDIWWSKIILSRCIC